MGKTTCNYNAGNKDMVSFRGNTICRVMSKSVGENSDLWEIEVQGRRGYAPKSMIMEQKIFIKAAELVRVTEKTNTPSSGVPLNAEDSFENATDSEQIIDLEPTEFNGSQQVDGHQVDNANRFIALAGMSSPNEDLINVFSEKRNSENDVRNHQDEDIEMNSDKIERPHHIGIQTEPNIEYVEEYSSETLTCKTNGKSLKTELKDILSYFGKQEKCIINPFTDTAKMELFASSSPERFDNLKKEESSESKPSENIMNPLNIQNYLETTVLHDVSKLEPFPEVETESNITTDSLNTKDDIKLDEEQDVFPNNEDFTANISLSSSIDDNESQIVENVEDKGINDNKVTEKSVRTDHLANFVDIDSKDTEENIFLANSDSKPSTENESRNWYGTSKVNEILAAAVNFYNSYFHDQAKETNEKKCKAGMKADAEENNIFGTENAPIKTQTESCDTNYEHFIYGFFLKLSGYSNLVKLLIIESAAVLIFIFGHFWLANRREENKLVSMLNIMERKLFASEKECSIAKAEVFEKRKVLDGIADKSFGTDDMIMKLEEEKSGLREQICVLEKELEAAAEAGLELNKMVGELLSNNQSGSDSIINSVEELQLQLNEQEATTIYINNLLAEKSRENSELKVQLLEIEKSFEIKFNELLNTNKILIEQKETAETDMKNMIKACELDVDEKMNQLIQYKDQNARLKTEYDDMLSKWQFSAAQAEAMTDALSKIENSSAVDVTSILEIVDSNAKYLEVKKKNEFLKDSLVNEKELCQRLQNEISAINDENLQLRTLANQYEKEKLEAQTRLDVLSSYFKEKENQLQR